MAAERNTGSQQTPIRPVITDLLHRLEATIFRTQIGMSPEELARTNKKEETITSKST